MFHWACLDKYARELPATTAPAGYTCPTCKDRIFPDSKLVSPVADVLREKLAGVNWARAGLGLPLVCALGNSTLMPIMRNICVYVNICFAAQRRQGTKAGAGASIVES